MKTYRFVTSHQCRRHWGCRWILITLWKFNWVKLVFWTNPFTFSSILTQNWNFWWTNPCTFSLILTQNCNYSWTNPFTFSSILTQNCNFSWTNPFTLLFRQFWLKIVIFHGLTPLLYFFVNFDSKLKFFLD